MRKFLAAVLILFAGQAHAYSITNVDTNAALKALAGGVTPAVYRAGYYAGGDGGDALYVWNAGSSCTDDGGSCIAPNSGTGRWLLNTNGAVSVKVFGAKCDGSTDDTAKINTTLQTIGAAFIPSNSTCDLAVNSASDGLIVGGPNNGANIYNNWRLYGQNQGSTLKFDVNYTPSYDFVTNGNFTNISVTSNVATLTTPFSHYLNTGDSITISGSATTCLNHTFTILGGAGSPSQPPSWATLKFNTSGCANGTYTDPTHITGPSGLGLSLIRTVTRDLNDANKITNFELDHLTIRDNGTNEPLTWIDLSGARDSQVHNIHIDTVNPFPYNNKEIALRCSDTGPNFNNQTSCFFNHVYDLNTYGLQTALQYISFAGNANTNHFEDFSGCTEQLIDSQGDLQANSGTFMNWYFCSDGAPLSSDFAAGAPVDALIQGVGIEGATTVTQPTSNTFLYRTFVDTAQIQALFIPFVFSVTPLLTQPCPSNVPQGALAIVTDWNGSMTSGTAITGSGGGTSTIIAVCAATGWQVH